MNTRWRLSQCVSRQRRQIGAVVLPAAIRGLRDGWRRSAVMSQHASYDFFGSGYQIRLATSQPPMSEVRLHVGDRDRGIGCQADAAGMAEVVQHYVRTELRVTRRSTARRAW